MNTIDQCREECIFILGISFCLESLEPLLRWFFFCFLIFLRIIIIFLGIYGVLFATLVIILLQNEYLNNIMDVVYEMYTSNFYWI